MKTYITFLIIFFLLSSCLKNPSTKNLEVSLQKVTQLFPQLPKSQGSLINFYQLHRSVKIGKINVEIQLRKTPQYIEESQQIIVISNSIGKSYAIPLFSNAYKDYWNFEFDNKTSNVKKTNSTFMKEYYKAIHSLDINDTLGTSDWILYEIFFSILHCEELTESDSLNISEVHLESDNSRPEDLVEDCEIRYLKTLKAINKDMHPKEYTYNYSAYWDKKNNRIYQLNNQGKRREKFRTKMKVYRQDCNVHALFY